MENEEHVSHRELDGAQNAPPTRFTGTILAGKGSDLKRLFHEPFAIHGAPVEEVLLPCGILDEPEPLVYT